MIGQTTTKLNRMENFIDGESGTQLAKSLNVFSSQMITQPNTVLYGQTKIC